MTAAVVRSIFEDDVPPTEHTLLMSAAIKGDAKSVQRYLKQKGQQDRHGYTALMLAVMNEQLECTRLLAPCEAKIQDNFGCTALMHAAKRGSVDIISLLLEHEVGIRCFMGWTALTWGLDCQNPAAIDLLLHVPEECSAPLTLLRAIARCSKDIVAKISKHAQFADLKSARDWALKRGYTDAVDVLDTDLQQDS
ncbi:Ankyrin repeat protein 1 [Giardia duodenalis]|uniref:Ankyrin repeat protein 1 n=2 Tax=Giardia intestinalis TaxID=5741 RepID=E2RU71_GIAIC|nr:Ankyrin repeat protein 1 [Giardia intestinalis]AAK38643.1 protein 21.5 [Giardia intestinalis]KAE8303941.1 Ankyrin repeat protein 1 [Giardia intestinalis]|eukprot:XP_001706639.1 Protein 21.1 [Giardia lamblia ATCC 50803]